MGMNSSKMLFLSTMIMGILMSISSNNWIMMWCGLEISLMSFTPLMISKSILSSESSMKYFIVQSISSAMLMLGVLFMIMKGDYNYEYLLMTSLLLKMGVLPFHNWVLTVIEGLDFHTTFILLSFNKMAPLCLMSYTASHMTMIICLTVMFGAILGLNQNSVKKIMGYSSIFNMGFILSVIKLNLMWMFYFTVYSIILLMMTKMMMFKKINLVNQIMFSSSMSMSMTMWINMLSMGGMPPLMGFSIKYMVLMYMVMWKMNMIITFMLLSSLLVLFFYLRLTFISSMNSFITNKMKLFNLEEISLWIMMINAMFVPVMMMVKTYL